MKSGDALKDAARATETKHKLEQARQRRIAQLQAAWVPGSQLTPEQLAEVQPNLKRDFLEREARRAA